MDGAQLALSQSAAPAAWYRRAWGQARYGQGRLIGEYGVAPFVVCIRIRILPACPPATLKIYACDRRAMAKNSGGLAGNTRS